MAVKQKNEKVGLYGPLPKDKAQSHFEDVISRYEKEFNAWHVRARKILDIYVKQRESSSSSRKMALLRANINVLQPAIYARTPSPSVMRRFKDADPLANMASQMVERCLSYSFDMERADAVFKMVRDDSLLVGRGTAWVRYVAETQPQTDPLTGDPILGPDGSPAEEITSQRLSWDYVHWRDFGHNVARHWAEVTDCWRKVYMNRADLRARFTDLSPEELAMIPLDYKPQAKEAQSEANKQAIVYEIWSKVERKVYWIVKGYHKPLDVADPLVELHEFFPCPRPVYTTVESSSLIPTPDYVYYQDQAEEIDDLTAKIANLQDSLKFVGFYPAGMDGDVQSAIEKAASPNTQNKMVPVQNWGALAQSASGGGFQWWPADTVAKTIDDCIQIRKALIDDVWMLTGISDIVRGQGQASETATQSNIKAEWGSMRIRDRQADLARFIEDMARIGGEIIAENFTPETLNGMSNMNLPSVSMIAASLPPGAPPEAMPAPPITIDAVAQLLRDDRLRGYHIKVSTDQMVEVNEQAEKAARIELMGALGNIVQQATPVLMSPLGAAMAPVIGEVGLFAIRSFKAGRQVEDAISAGFEGLLKQLQAPKEPQVDPVAQAKVQAAQAKADADKGLAEAQKADIERRFIADQERHERESRRRDEELALKLRQMDHDEQVTGLELIERFTGPPSQ